MSAPARQKPASASARRAPVPAAVSRPLPTLERLVRASGALAMAAGGAAACNARSTTAQGDLAPTVTVAPVEPAGAGSSGVVGGLAGLFTAPGMVTTASAHVGGASNPRAVPGQSVAVPAPPVGPPATPTHVTTTPPSRPPHPYLRRGVMASVRHYPYKAP